MKADPREFEYHEKKEGADEDDKDEQYTEKDCLKFKLHVRCTKKDPSAPMIVNNTVDEEKFYNNSNVYTSHMQWLPMGSQ